MLLRLLNRLWDTWLEHVGNSKQADQGNVVVRFAVQLLIVFNLSEGERNYTLAGICHLLQVLLQYFCVNIGFTSISL